MAPAFLHASRPPSPSSLRLAPLLLLAYGCLSCCGAWGPQRKPSAQPRFIYAAQRSNMTASVDPSAEQPRLSASPSGIIFGSNGIYNRVAGPVMSRPINVYLIWIGRFWPVEMDLVRTFIASLNQSPNKNNTVRNWWRINMRYYGGRVVNNQATGGMVSGRVVLRGEYATSAAAFGLRDNVLSDVFGAIVRVMSIKRWPADPTAFYAVITDDTIRQVGTPFAPYASSCVDYCGWHYFAYYRGKRIVYSWQGKPGCPYCGASFFSTNGGPYAAPSVSPGIHQAISTLAHELAETASDPYGTSWVDEMGNENADKCQANFGKLYPIRLRTGHTAVYNTVGLKGYKYVLQQNWDPVLGRCMTGV